MVTNEDSYGILLNDLWTFYLTFSGILLSIITLLYSFIIGKKNELEIYVDFTIRGKKDPLIIKRRRLAEKYIRKLKFINKWCFVLFILSSASCISCWVAMRFLPSSYFEDVLLIIVGVTFIIIVGTVGLLRNLYKKYKDDTKI